MSGIAVAVVIVLAVLAGRVAFVAVVQRAHWRAAAAAQSRARVVLTADRGDILDRNGVDLATDVGELDVVVDPEQVDNVDYYAHALSPVLGIDESTLRYDLRRQQLPNKEWLQYRVIARHLDTNAAEILREMSFPGISVTTAPARTYPGGSLAAALLGRTVPDANGPTGVSGLEQQYNSLLQGTSGMEVAVQARSATCEPAKQQTPGSDDIVISQHVQRPAHPGSDLQLSLDEGIQYQAEKTVLAQVAAQQARSGMAVVVDLKTGDVLAMVSVIGGAHPHVATANDAELPLTFAYNPGSVMKIVTVSKAFDSGCLQTTDHYIVPYQYANGSVNTITDDETHPTETLTPWDILTQSSNVGTAEIAQKCIQSPQMMQAAQRSFGFGRKTGVGFKGEASGLLEPPSVYADSGLMSNAIGYSVLVTPMQMLDAYATIARDGVPVQPRPGARRHCSGRRAPRHAGALRRGVVSSATATTMQQIFENVVRAGTGYSAAVPGYEVAGKTGTLHKQGPAARTDPGGHFATFAGFAPATAPRLAAITVFDDPSSTYGGSAAAPAWSQIMSTTLTRMQVAAPAPIRGLPPQYDQAMTGPNGRSHKGECSIPPLEQTMRNRAAQAYAAAHPTTTTTSTTTSTTTPRTTTTVAPAHKPTPARAGDDRPERDRPGDHDHAVEGRESGRGTVTGSFPTTR